MRDSMKYFIKEFLGWSFLVMTVGGLIWVLFWFLPATERQHEEDCKTYIHPSSRSIYMGLHAERACSHPDGVPRYLP